MSEDTEIQLLKKKLEREKKARKQAELILEQKSIELFKANLKLLSINDDLEAFIYIIAHDFKAPLRVINSFTNLINRKKTVNIDPDIEEYLGYISQSSKDLYKLVDNLLEYSRQIQAQDLKFEDIQFEGIIQETLRILDPLQNKLEYSFQIDHNVFLSSKSIIKQIFRNIISNAIKYKDNKKSNNWLKIRVEHKSDYTNIIFEDNGIGISKERLKTIFKLFDKDTREKSSSGVGLSVIKGLLKRVKGKIDVKSEIDIGTCVTITLPAK